MDTQSIKSNWDRDTINLGDVNINTKVKADFKYIGDNTIRDFTFSCDCINHQLTNDIYSFYFETKQKGTGSKLIIVHYKNGDKDILTIKYNVI